MKTAKAARPLLLSIGQDWDRHYGSAKIAVRMSGVCHVFSGVLGDLGGSSFQFESLTKSHLSNVRKNWFLSRLFAYFAGKSFPPPLGFGPLSGVPCFGSKLKGFVRRLFDRRLPWWFDL